MLKEGLVRIPSGCAISGIFHKKGKNINGSEIVKSIAVMHDRSNGLGGGFAGYGIYPEYKDYYAFHIFYDDISCKLKTEEYLQKHFDIVNLSKIPTKKIEKIKNQPLIWRYFVTPLATKMQSKQLDEKEYTAQCVIKVNCDIEGAYIFSSGKNMGVFKAVGYPEDVGEFYMLERYEGYSWTAHGRYPTNTPGWWGGAHPFNLLDYSVVHNGEISSYDANRRYIESFGYNCNLLTDTEVICYIIDFLNRKQRLHFNDIASIIAAPFWSTIDKMDEKTKEKLIYFRNNYASLLITGPFSVLIGTTGKLMALNDRLKLRSMVIGETKDKAYIASEECAIRAIEPDLEKFYSPKGGEAVIFSLGEDS
ncbi:MAG: class II glutamine amidotransferase [Bacillota bacterium]